MKVWISVDMEGIGGIGHDDPTEPGARGYEAAAALMVGEANAAIDGACSGGASEVIVNDSHWSMWNLPAEALDPRAILISGEKPWSMVTGAGPGAGIGVALFVGYHTRAGHPTGTIAHTYSGAPVSCRLAGRPVGETGINAAVLGHWGVPVGLVTGDDALAGETAEWLPWAERVVVKTVVSRHAAASVHPSMARDRVRDGARRAVEQARAGALRPLVIAPPVEIEVDYRNAGEADHAAMVPGAERIGDTGVRHSGPDAVSAYRGFLAGIRLAGLVG